ncbi:MAG TPA: penicillin-binding protein [Anaerolineaceae bacterium]|nr:penicillin-binding protein [Anaerolineaceae bacterium]HPN52426.1 penicillin-binding protein [Anaerolineaceae bacterium]
MRALNTYLAVRGRNRRKNQTQASTRQRMGRFGLGVGALFSLCVAFSLLAAGWLAVEVTHNLPSVSRIPDLLDAPNGLYLQPVRLYDQSGLVLLYASAEGPRKVIPVQGNTPSGSSQEYLPPALVMATLATTDQDFWTNPGFSLRNGLDGNPRTLAEHLVREFLLEGETESWQKAARMRLLAAQLTATYGRERILGWFLNNQYYGQGAYGIEAAAQTYYSKPAATLELNEVMALVAMGQSPEFDALTAPEVAYENQQKVVDLLDKKKLLSQDQIAFARRQPTLAPKKQDEVLLAPAFVALSLRQLENKIGRVRLERGGLIVRTSLDLDLQKGLTCAIQEQIKRVEGGTLQDEMGDCETAWLLPTDVNLTHDAGLQASGIILDPINGRILALTGDMSLAGGEMGFTRSHEAGTLLTPFIYLSAFVRGYGPGSLVWDIPASLPSTAHDVGDLDFHGPQRIRMAMVNDYLAPAAQYLAEIGPGNVWGTAEALGLPAISGEALPFSGGRISLMQAAQAFGVFAANGQLRGQQVMQGRLSSSALLRIDESNGNTLLDWSQPVSQSVITEPLAYLVNHVLSDEAARWPTMGYPNDLEIGRPAAAKIGRTTDGFDTWVAGYTPQRVVVIWAGRDQENNGKAVDLHTAMGLWHAIMQYTVRNLPPEGWSRPAGISEVTVCDPSGLLPSQDCPSVVSEVFLTGNEPTTVDNLYRSYRINRETGRLATIFSPQALVEEKVFMLVPLNAREWAADNKVEMPPDLYDAIQIPESQPDINITSPGWFSVVGGEVRIIGSAAGDNFSSYRLQAGSGLNPENWLEIGSESLQPVKNDVLAVWDTSHMADGLYAIRLTVVNKEKRINTAILQVTVDNTPPKATLLYPHNGDIFKGDQKQIVFRSNPEDESGISKVEWWLDDMLIGETRQSPFIHVWNVKKGSHQLRVKVFDQTGQSSETFPIYFSVK